MTVTMQDIREQYPNPVAEKDAIAGAPDCCVAGAFLCVYLGLPPWHPGVAHGFPMVDQVAEYLMDAQPLLMAEEADVYALLIVEANDRRDFDTAWDVLDQALRGEALPAKE